MLLQEFDYAFDVEGDDGFLAFFGFQEGKVVRIVVEEILGEYGCCIGVFEQVERCLEVGIAVGVVGADAVAGKVFPGSVVEAGGQLGGGFLVEGDVHIVVLFLVIDGDLAVDAAGFDEVPDLFVVEAGSVFSWTRSWPRADEGPDRAGTGSWLFQTVAYRGQDSPEGSGILLRTRIPR